MDGSYDYDDCIGLRVKPRQGDGLLFYSLLPNGTIDPVSIALIIAIIFLFFTFLIKYPIYIDMHLKEVKISTIKFVCSKSDCTIEENLYGQGKDKLTTPKVES